MFILASGSPRRKELLHKVVDEFTIIVPDIDESHHPLDPKDLPKELSKEKAYAVSRFYPNDEILACDTVVILDKEVLGKPKSVQNAIEMLKKQSGKRQIVLSGYTYIGKGKEISRSVATEVYFNELSEEQIIDYVTRFKPFDKAGSYGIQDDFPLIKKIVGSYDNVMGLPTEDIREHIL
ncbi:MAG: Maf family protein [Bacilli bacterium]|nr:Maf family protein [Bacilli bacterium]